MSDGRLFLVQALLNRKLKRRERFELGAALCATGRVRGPVTVLNLKANPFPDWGDDGTPAPPWPTPQAFMSAMLAAPLLSTVVDAANKAIQPIAGEFATLRVTRVAGRQGVILAIAQEI